VKELRENGKAVISEGALVVPLDDLAMPPFILTKTNGSFLYSTTDLATIKFRAEQYNCDLVMYLVDYRQSLHFKQVFATACRVGYIKEENKLEHISYGTLNGKDNKPFKTRSGDTVNLRDLLAEAVGIIREKSSVANEETIQKVAVACLKFSDLVNYRDSSYVFDLEQFTNFEGKTGAYILYNLVRIKSILGKNPTFENKITMCKTPEERALMLELTNFWQVFGQAYTKRAPHHIAEYIYSIAKKFSSFYSVCPIKDEKDELYKQSKLSLLSLTKKYFEVCLDLLNILPVDEM
jgi:arginyl-tRNA synthetase